MISLLKIEWLKVKAYRVFWTLIGVFAVGAPLLCAGNKAINEKIREKMPLIANPFGFPEAYETVGWLTSFLTPVMGILLIILLTNENNFRTIRQNIIDGWGRQQYTLAKFGVLIVMVLFITLLVTITALVYGATVGGDPSDGTEALLYSAIQSLTYLSAAFFLGAFLKRSGIAIAIYVFYAYVVEFPVTALLDFKVKFHLGGFLPLECTDRLLPGQSNLFRKLLQQAPPPDKIWYIVAALAYTALFLGLSWRRMKKADL